MPSFQIKIRDQHLSLSLSKSGLSNPFLAAASKQEFLDLQPLASELGRANRSKIGNTKLSAGNLRLSIGDTKFSVGNTKSTIGKPKSNPGTPSKGQHDCSHSSGWGGGPIQEDPTLREFSRCRWNPSTARSTKWRALCVVTKARKSFTTCKRIDTWCLYT